MGTNELLAYSVSINQYVSIPALDQAVQGFKDAIREAKIEEVDYIVHIANARKDETARIVELIKGEKPDLILAVATPSALPTVEAIKDIPILFTAVTDPVSSNLVNSLENPGGNATGTTDLNPVADHIALIKDIQPDLTSLGIIFNIAESNSVVQVKMAQAKAAELGIQIITETIDSSEAAGPAVQKLVGQVDAIYLPTDNSVISGYDDILKEAIAQKLPIYPADEYSFRKGGVASVALNYYQLGRQTGVMAVSILKDKVLPANMPVQGQQNHKLLVNLAFTQKIGLTVPDSVLSKADETIK
jgi:putative ABC transport system substrate-binding protein